MASSSSSPQSSHSGSATRSPAKKRTAGVVGAVVGAVVGGVLGAVLVKKARAGGAKRLVPAAIPRVGKRALTAVKGVAHDAKIVAKTAAGLAADAAVSQMKTAAQQFAVEVATGHRTTKPALPAATTPARSEGAARPRKKSAAKKPTWTKSTSKSKTSKAPRRAKTTKSKATPARS